MNKKEKHEKNILHEMKDMLLSLRRECINEIEERCKVLERSQKDIKKLLSIAEQKMMLKELREEEKKLNKGSFDFLKKTKNELKELQNKFNKVPE